MNESVRRSGPSARVGEISIRELSAEIDRRWADANRGSKAWSAAFHLTFGLATAAGVVVAAITYLIATGYDAYGLTLKGVPLSQNRIHARLALVSRSTAAALS